MKIILTENQLQLLKLIKENEDVLNQFTNRISAVNKALNKFYTDINFISLAELLNGEVDVKLLIQKSDNLDSEQHKIGKDMERYFKSFGDDAYFDKWVAIHHNLDSLNYKNYDKINAISSILMDLDSLVDDNENTKNLFSDIKSVNLS
jgi:seryl-tRNA synthetase